MAPCTRDLYLRSISAGSFEPLEIPLKARCRNAEVRFDLVHFGEPRLATDVRLAALSRFNLLALVGALIEDPTDLELWHRDRELDMETSAKAAIREAGMVYPFHASPFEPDDDEVRCFRLDLAIQPSLGQQRRYLDWPIVGGSVLLLSRRANSFDNTYRLELVLQAMSDGSGSVCAVLPPAEVFAARLANEPSNLN